MNSKKEDSLQDHAKAVEVARERIRDAQGRMNRAHRDLNHAETDLHRAREEHKAAVAAVHKALAIETGEEIEP